MCISTSFWALCAPKSWPKYFFQTFFNLFCSFQRFSLISMLTSTKNVWKWTKNVILSTSQSWSTCKSWSTPWGGTPKLSFSVDFLLFLILQGESIQTSLLSILIYNYKTLGIINLEILLRFVNHEVQLTIHFNLPKRKLIIHVFAKNLMFFLLPCFK